MSYNAYLTTFKTFGQTGAGAHYSEHVRKLNDNPLTDMQVISVAEKNMPHGNYNVWIVGDCRRNKQGFCEFLSERRKATIGAGSAETIEVYHTSMNQPGLGNETVLDSENLAYQKSRL